MKMTWDKLNLAIDAVSGHGRQASYTPILTNSRRESSPVSIQISGRFADIDRPHHLKSLSECCAALPNRHSSVNSIYDIREQRPLWPWMHRHALKLSGLGDKPNLRSCSGLLKLGGDAGMDIGRIIGKQIPFVATLDLPIHICNAKVRSAVASDQAAGASQ